MALHKPDLDNASVEKRECRNNFLAAVPKLDGFFLKKWGTEIGDRQNIPQSVIVHLLFFPPANSQAVFGVSAFCCLSARINKLHKEEDNGSI